MPSCWGMHDLPSRHSGLNLSVAHVYRSRCLRWLSVREQNLLWARCCKTGCDLFIQPNDQPVIVKENHLGVDMCRWYRAAGIFGGAEPVLRVVGCVESFAPAWYIRCMAEA